MFERFPRPPHDTGIGFHYYPDSRHFSQDDLRRWVPELKKLHASWLTLRASPQEPVPTPFLRGLRKANIEPVIEITHIPGYRWHKGALIAMAAHYRDAGVRYLTLLPEPNVAANWSIQEWQRPNLVSRVMRVVLPAMEAFANEALYPLLPPLRAGGSYWDTAFLSAMLDHIKLKASPRLLERMGLCIHNYAFNRPLSWGAGGQTRWGASGPFGSVLDTGAALASSEDHRGWRIWEWYDEIVRARLDRSLPMISGAGGAMLEDQDQADLPPTTLEQHTERNLQIVGMRRAGEYPEYLFNQSFWLLAADEGDPFCRQAWFQPDGTVLPIVSYLTSMSFHEATGKAPETQRTTNKAITHYLLLPSWEWGVSSLHWEAVRPFVQRSRPTVGFSVEEAMLADRVTIPIGTQGFAEETVSRLRAAGCVVETVPAPDYHTLQHALAEGRA